MLSGMVLLGLILLLVGIGLWLAPHSLRPPARTIGAILAAIGGILIAVDLLDLTASNIDDD